MVKSVDTRDLKSLASKRPGSSPGERTIIIALCLILSACSPRVYTAEEKWIMAQDNKCHAAKSRGAYNRETKIYECWNKPAFRRPKLVFGKSYLEKK